MLEESREQHGSLWYAAALFYCYGYMHHSPKANTVALFRIAVSGTKPEADIRARV